MGKNKVVKRYRADKVSNATVIQVPPGVTRMRAAVRIYNENGFLGSSGQLWNWGYNGSGQMGNGSNYDTAASNPYPVMSGTGHLYRKAQSNPGRDGNFGLDMDGNIWSWGTASDGQLGNGNSSTDQSTPTMVIGGFKFKDFVAGDSHCLAMTEDGFCVVWGYNLYGQLGDGGGSFGTNRSTPTGISISTVPLRRLWAGGDYSYAQTQDGKLYAWGQNQNGQLILQPNSTGFTDYNFPGEIPGSTFDYPVVDIACGQSNVHFLLENGDVWAIGANGDAQLGDGTLVDKSSPVQIMAGTKFKRIASNSDNCYMIDENDDMYSTGINSYGYRGDGNNTYTPITTPTLVIGGIKWRYMDTNSCGYSPVVAVDMDNQAWCWGYGDGGIGNGTQNNYSSPVQVVGGPAWDMVFWKTIADTLIDVVPNSDLELNLTNGSITVAGELLVVSPIGLVELVLEYDA